MVVAHRLSAPEDALAAMALVVRASARFRVVGRAAVRFGSWGGPRCAFKSWCGPLRASAVVAPAAAPVWFGGRRCSTGDAAAAAATSAGAGRGAGMRCRLRARDFPGWAARG